MLIKGDHLYTFCQSSRGVHQINTTRFPHLEPLCSPPPSLVAVVAALTDPPFVAATQKFAFGDDAAVIRDGRVATLQSLSGTGALRLAVDVLAQVTVLRVCVFLMRLRWPLDRP